VSKLSRTHRIILFDGVCNFCNFWVQFIIRHDKKAQFQFASLQSEMGKALLSAHGVPHPIDTIVYIENDKCYFQSTAVLHICKEVGGLWKLFYAFIFLPLPIRDAAYRWVAMHRYRWFGQRKMCQVLPKEIQERFLDRMD
jgi:predicted DCC family thiol-disulfide oxidoreductase YuxK